MSPPHNQASDVAVMQRGETRVISDIDLARRAAAEISKRDGYPQLEGMYLRGDCDADADVQAALLAITLVRRLESVTA